MTEYIIQILMAALGAAAYCLLFNIRRNKIAFCAIIAGCTWTVYILCENMTDSIFVCNMLSSAFATLISEMAARILKAPTTCFLIPAVIPLIPGGGLYHTMEAALIKNTAAFESYLSSTVQATFGISIGIMLMSLVAVRLIRRSISPIRNLIH